MVRVMVRVRGSLTKRSVYLSMVDLSQPWSIIVDHARSYLTTVVLLSIDRRTMVKHGRPSVINQPCMVDHSQSNGRLCLINRLLLEWLTLRK